MAKKYLLATIQKIESPSFYGFPLKGKDSMIILAGFFFKHIWVIVNSCLWYGANNKMFYCL